MRPPARLPGGDFSSAAGRFDVAVWNTARFDFVATGNSSTLTLFGTLRGPANSVFIGLDNVSVTGAVPEPASAVLALLGLAMVGAAGRRVHPHDPTRPDEEICP